MPKPSDSDPDANAVPSVEWNTMDIIKYQLGEVRSDLKTITKELRASAELHTKFLVWKENTEGRLVEGLRVMKETEDKVRESRDEIKKCREDFLRHMDNSNKEFRKAMEILVTEKIDPLNERTPEKVQEKMDLRYIRRDMVKWVVFGFMLSGAAGGALGKMILDFVTRH